MIGGGSLGIQWNGQQQEAISEIEKWWRSSRQLYELSGVAGSGKSTLLNHTIFERIGLNKNEVVFVTFTGKASQVLNRKGIFSKTIHSQFYETKYVQKVRDGKPVEQYGRPVMERLFQLKEYIDPNIKLVVIDEAGNAGARLGEDIMSFGIKVLACGDINQLPPVMDKLYFLKEPDYRLTQVMRQAEDNPIVMLSQMFLNGDIPRNGIYKNKVFIVYESEVKDEIKLRSDIILCCKNNTRDLINSDIKGRILGRDLSKPYIGDKVICRKNNWNKYITDDNGNEIYLINGLIGHIQSIDISTYTKSNKTINIDLLPEFIKDESNRFIDIPLDTEYFKLSAEERKMYKTYGDASIPIEFANAI